jgi:prepilin-type N-terminal cleavage/methylation domain-containing protein
VWVAGYLPDWGCTIPLSSRPLSSRTGRDDEGFSLIELVIVLGLLSIVSIMAFQFLHDHSGRGLCLTEW